MRLIDADEIVYESIDEVDVSKEFYKYGTGILAVRKEDIDEMPTAETPRIRGQWSIKGQAIDTVRGYWAKCSACGHSVFGGGNYCSYCGSYNKGEVTT